MWLDFQAVRATRRTDAAAQEAATNMRKLGEAFQAAGLSIAQFGKAVRGIAED
jgi:hypothetical protein